MTISANLQTDLQGHTHPIYTIEHAGDNRTFFTAGGEGAVVEWDLLQSDKPKIIFKGSSTIYALHKIPHLPVLACGERNGSIHLYNLEEKKLIGFIHHHHKAIFDLKSSASGNLLFAASDDGKVSAWELDKLKLVAETQLSDQSVRVLAANPDETSLAAGCRDNHVRIIHTNNFHAVQSFEAHSMPVFSLVYTANGEHLISGSRDAQLKIWDGNTLCLLEQIPAHMFAINHLALHPSSGILVSASMDKSIRLWDSSNFKLLKSINPDKCSEAHRLSVNKVCWLDEETLISVGDDKRVKIWQIRINGE